MYVRVENGSTRSGGRETALAVSPLSSPLSYARYDIDSIDMYKNSVC